MTKERIKDLMMQRQERLALRQKECIDMIKHQNLENISANDLINLSCNLQRYAIEIASIEGQIEEYKNMG